jgi:transposase-like protein
MFEGVGMEFKWKHTDRMIIIMAIRWYVSYSLSYRQVEELLGFCCKKRSYESKVSGSVANN